MAETDVRGVIVVADDKALVSALGSYDRAIVFFHADWCPHCRDIAPYFADLSGTSELVFLSILVPRESELWQKYGLGGIPAFQVFVNGGKVDECMGDNRGELRALVERNA